MRPAALLFDWDNTLVDSWDLLHRCMNATLSAMGHEPWSAAEVRERMRASLRDAFPALFGERWQDARSVYYESFERFHLDHLRPLPGAEELLRQARDAGLYLAVVSNKTGRYLRQEVAHLGWQDLFGTVVGAQDAPADKPDPVVVRMALEPSGLAAGRHVWFVGDTDIDMRCAVNAGCHPVLIGDGQQDDFSMFDPMARFHDLIALQQDLVSG